MKAWLYKDQTALLLKLSKERLKLGKRLVAIHREAIDIIAGEPGHSGESYPDEDLGEYLKEGLDAPEFDYEEQEEVPTYIVYGESEARKGKVRRLKEEIEEIEKELNSSGSYEEEEEEGSS